MKTTIPQILNEKCSQVHFRLRAFATIVLVAAAVAFVLGGLFATGTPDLTGTYMADDGGIYYVQQSGSTLWWAGMSLDNNLAPDLQWHRGLNFTNVFRGTINSDNSISGEWTDVTRGTSLNYGTLTVKIGSSGGMTQFMKVSYTGSFGANAWTQTGPLDDTQFDGEHSDIYSKFGVVHKNGGETLVHDLKPYRDSTVFYGQLMTSAMDLKFAEGIGYYGVATHEPPLVNYPTWGTAFRTYSAFAGENGDDEGNMDGDFDLRVKIDLNKLESDFSLYGWENHDQAPDIISWKLNSQLLHDTLGLGSRFAYMHPEAIEYGIASGLSLLPGWADLSSNSILVNGRPINGQVVGPNTSEPPDPPCGFVQPCPYKDYGDLTGGIRIGNLQLTAGTYIRVTGVLALDCGHGATTPCYDDPSDQDEVSRNQNQEIHPVYSIDVLNPPFTPEDIGVYARPNLTGTWGGSDGSTYYIRQIGNTIWGFGQLRDRQPNQQGTSYDLIGTRQVAAAGFLVGSPVCGSTMRCWMFGTVIKGTISNNADGSSTIQGDWAGAPQSTSPGSTGGSVTFGVDKYHKVITPQTMQVLFPDKLEKMYEPVTDILPPQSTLTIGNPQFSSSTQTFVGSTTQFNLSAYDGDSGVQNSWYRFYPTGSANPPAYTPVIGSSASFMVTGPDGSYEVDTYATDNAGNDEMPHSQTIYLDAMAPVTTISAPVAKQYLHSDSFTISYTVSDGTGSGVKSAIPDIDGQTTLNDGTTPVTVTNGLIVNLLTELALGPHTFNVNAKDNLGNSGTTTVSFSIVVTADSIKDDVKYFRSIGAITLDEATSLLQKLNAAAAYRAKGDCKDANATYQAFINEVRAQKGKKISAQAAALLIADAQYLIAHCP